MIKQITIHHKSILVAFCKKRLFLLILSFFFTSFTFGQYYGLGQNASKIRWRQIKTPNFQLVYPEYYEQKAMQYAAFLDSIAVFDNFGLNGTRIRLPILLQTQNLQSNGVVAWAPKRMELITAPSVNNFATPWEKQLLIHEYRHVMQMSKLNQGFTRGLSFVLGEQGLGLMSAFVPSWFLEGDATVAETQMTTFGRGLQPEFSLAHRVNILEKQKLFTYDQIMFGSYKIHTPNVYEHGYLMVSTAQTLFGIGFWDSVMNFAGRKPYLFWNFTYGMIQHGGVNKGQLHKKTFNYLTNSLDTIGFAKNSGEIISANTPTYTDYSFPMQINDTLIVAFKSDLQRTGRLVAINPKNGNEKTLLYTGYITGQPSMYNQTLAWTEYRPHIRWEQINYSCIRTYNFQTGEDILSKAKTADFSPIFINKDTLACISLDSLSNSHVIIKTQNSEIARYSLQGTNMQSIAFDTSLQQLSFIALGEKGMWIGLLNPKTSEILPLTESRFITIRNLSSDNNGNLYFSSIYEGIEEIHKLDIATRQEFVVTTSHYGSVHPSFSQNKIVYSTYTKDGYQVAQQADSIAQKPIFIEDNKPIRQVMPKFVLWNNLNADTISFFSNKTYLAKSYRKISHLVNVHSWMPFYAMDIPTEQTLTSLGFGATLLSQNLLNTLSVTTAYGRVNKKNVWHTNLTYSEWFPIIELDIKYGGGKQMLYGFDNTEDILNLKNYFSTTANISVPLNFSKKNKQIFLIPNVSATYSNALIYSEGKQIEGYLFINNGIYYQNQWKKAVRDIFPRHGIALQANIEGTPFQQEFGTNYMAYARWYMPGFFPNQGWMFRGSIQKQKTSDLNFTSTYLYPRELVLEESPQNLWSVSADYSLPVWYPDFNIIWIVYFKRIYINAFGDYARYHYQTIVDEQKKIEVDNTWSSGVDVNVELVPLRIGFPINLNFRFAQTSEGFRFGFGLGVDFGK